MVVGLLEVFSPLPRAFTEVHETALSRLSELVPKAQSVATPPRDVKEMATSAFAEPPPTANAIREAIWETEREAQELLKGVPVRLGHIVSLVVAVALLALGAGYKQAPQIEKLWFTPAKASGQDPARVGATPAE